MVLYEGKLSIICFLLPLPLASLHFFMSNEVYSELSDAIIWTLTSYVALSNALIHTCFNGFAHQVAVRASGLGYVFTAGILVMQYFPPQFTVFGWYMCVMAVFHYTEFMTIAISNPKTLGVDSFILNHSNAYYIAAVSSWVEFLIEAYFFPELKLTRVVSLVGLGLCVLGECLRKAAMLTAQSNFNHVVQSVKQQDHQLITHGVYALFRHPSYVGWFYWSLGTQLILVNPICLVGYALASWKFFSDRITVEEMTLLNFFGEKYEQYQQRVGIGLPLIKGYHLD